MLKPITNAALTNALKELEKDELVQRIQYNEMPLRGRILSHRERSGIYCRFLRHFTMGDEVYS